MLNWFLQLAFDDFNGVFTDNGQDLQYKKLNWFLECQKFLKRGDLLYNHS